jgi:hypothetical protein
MTLAATLIATSSQNRLTKFNERLELITKLEKKSISNFKYALEERYEPGFPLPDISVIAEAVRRNHVTRVHIYVNLTNDVKGACESIHEQLLLNNRRFRSINELSLYLIKLMREVPAIPPIMFSRMSLIPQIFVGRENYLNYAAVIEQFNNAHSLMVHSILDGMSLRELERISFGLVAEMGITKVDIENARERVRQGTILPSLPAAVTGIAQQEWLKKYEERLRLIEELKKGIFDFAIGQKYEAGLPAPDVSMISNAFYDDNVACIRIYLDLTDYQVGIKTVCGAIHKQMRDNINSASVARRTRFLTKLMGEIREITPLYFSKLFYIPDWYTDYADVSYAEVLRNFNNAHSLTAENILEGTSLTQLKRINRKQFYMAKMGITASDIRMAIEHVVNPPE